MSLDEKLKKAEDETDKNPTERQKETGNYKKGKITIKGLKITIENPKGSLRSGIDKEGKKWETKMLYPYGYFNGTEGKDGDAIDVFIGPEIDTDFEVFVIDQVDEDTRAFDEHKVMFGFADEAEAKKAYIKSYAKGWKGFNHIATFSLKKFKTWIKNKDAIKYPVKKLSMSSKINFVNKFDDRIKVIRMFGEVLEGKTLNILTKQAGNISSFDTLVVEIASPGGSVSEGLEIMIWLDSLSQKGKQIITVVVANAYSIASLIMLVANIKVISKHGKVMVHNPMVPEIQYVNANDLEEYIGSLRDLEQVMYELYQIFTGLEKENIKKLMDNETYLSPQEAVDYGFSDMVVDIKSRPYEVASSNIKTKINMSKTLNILNKVIAMVNNEKFVNQTYNTEGGSAVEINQQDSSTYTVGDRTNVEEGEVKLSDGSKLIIKNYVIQNIDKAVEPAKEPIEDPAQTPVQDPVQNPVQDPAQIPTQGMPDEQEPKSSFNEGPAPSTTGDKPSKVIEKTQSTTTTKETVAAQITSIHKFETDVVQDTFEIGTKVEYVPFEKGEEPYSVGSGEWLLDDGRQVLTDADGVIRFIKEADPSPIVNPDAKESEDDKQAMETEEEAKAKETEEKMAEKVEKIVESKFKSLEEKVNSLIKNSDEKFEQVATFEGKATEAIETIAKATSSNFKPSAKGGVGKYKPKGSIFSQAKEKVGLG